GRALTPPARRVWHPEAYGPDGKTYDGWESRRRRHGGGVGGDGTGLEAGHAIVRRGAAGRGGGGGGVGGDGPGPAADHAIVRLGAPGRVRHVVIDTAFFRGNYPPYGS